MDGTRLSSRSKDELLMIVIWEFVCHAVHHLSQSLTKEIRICGLPSPWLEGVSSIARKLYYLNDVHLVANNIYMLWAFLYTMFIKEVSFQDLCSLALCVTSLLCGLSSFAYYLLHQHRLKHITDILDSFSDYIIELGGEQVYKAIHREKTRLIPVLSKILIFLPIFTISTYVIPVPVFDWLSGTYRSRHPLAFQSPFNDKLPGVYELLIFTQVAHISANTKKASMDCLFMAIFKSHSAVLRYLSEAMDDIGKDFTLGDVEEGHRKLVLWIKLHQNVIKNIQELYSVFSPMCIINNLNVVGVTVCGLFVQVKKNDDSIVQSLGVGFFVVVVISQLLVFTNAAEDFVSEAEKLGLKTYSLPWYNMKKSEKDMVGLIIAMSNRSIKITAYQTLIFLINRETFAGFVISLSHAMPNGRSFWLVAACRRILIDKNTAEQMDMYKCIN